MAAFLAVRFTFVLPRVEMDLALSAAHSGGTCRRLSKAGYSSHYTAHTHSTHTHAPELSRDYQSRLPGPVYRPSGGKSATRNGGAHRIQHGSSHAAPPHISAAYFVTLILVHTHAHTHFAGCTAHLALGFDHLSHKRTQERE